MNYITILEWLSMVTMCDKPDDDKPDDVMHIRQEGHVHDSAGILQSFNEGNTVNDDDAATHVLNFRIISSASSG